VLPLTDAEFEAIVAYSTKKKRRRQR
jgi:hypothetical protein